MLCPDGYLQVRALESGSQGDLQGLKQMFLEIVGKRGLGTPCLSAALNKYLFLLWRGGGREKGGELIDRLHFGQFLGGGFVTEQTRVGWG